MARETRFSQDTSEGRTRSKTRPLLNLLALIAAILLAQAAYLYFSGLFPPSRTTPARVKLRKAALIMLERAAVGRPDPAAMLGRVPRPTWIRLYAFPPEPERIDRMRRSLELRPNALKYGTTGTLHSGSFHETVRRS